MKESIFNTANICIKIRVRQEVIQWSKIYFQTSKGKFPSNSMHGVFLKTSVTQGYEIAAVILVYFTV